MDETKGERKFRLRDFLIVLFCLSGAAGCLCLFWKDLNITIDPEGPPVGFITKKVMVRNTVLRQRQGRELLERVLDGSLVHEGDTILVTKSSEAEIHIGDIQITLGPNTRAQIRKTKEGLLELYLQSGTAIIDNDLENKINVIFEVEKKRGTHGNKRETMEVLSPVGPGKVRVFNIIEEIDPKSQDPRVSVKSPWYGRRYLKNGPQVPEIVFEWKSFNIEPGEALTLEIAGDWKFTHAREITVSDDTATVPCDTGVWYWRLSHRGTPLANAEGMITVTEASIPVLYSPAAESVFTYQIRHPDLRFRWSEVDGASYYLLDVAETRDFSDPHIKELKVNGTSFVNSNLEPRAWFWRVQPVFSPVFPPVDNYRGGFSSVASFSIVQKTSLEVPVLTMPPPDHTFDIIADQNLYFSWTGNNDAVSYTVQISANQDLSNPLIKQTLQNNSFVESNLIPELYYWNVYNTDREGNDSHSDVRSFTVRDEIILRPVFPPENYTIATALLPVIIFKWESNVRFEKRFQVSSRSNFSHNEIDEPVVSGKSFQVSSDLYDRDWYWRVVTVKEGTMREEFLTTPPRRFSLISTLPAPVLVSPREGSQVQTSADRPVVFSWEHVNGAEYYRFNLYTAANQKVHERDIHISQGIISQTVPTNTLAEGDYYWTVQAVASESNVSTSRSGDPATGRFTLRKPLSLTLESPADRTVLPGLTALSQPTVFRWNTSEEVGSSRFVLSRNSDPLQGRPVREIPNPARTVSLNRLEEGVWYWTVEARTPDGIRINTGIRRLQVLPVPSPTLESPATGAVLQGLTALRQPTVFRWSADVEIGRSRFVLSRNSKPLEGRPAVEILNPGPGRTVTVPANRFGEGDWFWTVEVWTHDNIRLSDATPRRLRVEAIPLLPAPENRRPAEGDLFVVEELQTQGRLDFSWSAVNGANAYIFTLFQKTDNIKRQIDSIRIDSIRTENQIRWTLDDISHLIEGTFVWQVEAVNSTIEQYGRIVENTFYVKKGFVIGEEEVDIIYEPL